MRYQEIMEAPANPLVAMFKPYKAILAGGKPVFADQGNGVTATLSSSGGEPKKWFTNAKANAQALGFVYNPEKSKELSRGSNLGYYFEHPNGAVLITNENDGMGYKYVGRSIKLFVPQTTE